MDKGNDLIEELEIRKTIDGEPVGEHSPTGTPLRGTMEKGGTVKKPQGSTRSRTRPPRPPHLQRKRDAPIPTSGAYIFFCL